MVCFIDTNILAYWVLGEGGVLKSLIDRFGLVEKFLEIYLERYKKSILFIDEIIAQKSKGSKDEFFISSLATNELFSAIRDEVRSIVMFDKGIPISRWRDPRNTPDIDSKDYKLIYEKTLESFDILFTKKSILLITEISPVDDPNYWDIYASILFLIKELKTQDATLLTTSILNRADYFVTRDDSLIRCVKKTLIEKYELNVIKPSEALQILKRKAN